MTPDVLTRILTLRVDLRDEKACAEISPEMAERYLRARGWDPAREPARTWWRADDVVTVPHREQHGDYGRRMCEVVTEVARAEQRSPLAVWVDMMAQKETAA